MNLMLRVGGVGQCGQGIQFWHGIAKDKKEGKGICI